MNRWTMKELEEIDDIGFAIAILNERLADLSNPYAPLAKKIEEAIKTLKSLRK
jgi:hypothetical protein